MARITNDERTRIFGAPCNTGNHRNYLTPWGIRTVCHFLVLPRFAAACDLAKRASSWVPRRIDAYACRNIRDSDEWSIHSWAMAWDFFATPPGIPPPGGVWTPDNGVPPEFAAAFVRYGFTWGANFQRRDVPHIEWAGGRPDPITAPAPQEDDDMTPEQAADLTAVKNYVVDAQPRLVDLQGRLTAVEGKVRDGVNYDVDAQARLAELESLVRAIAAKVGA